MRRLLSAGLAAAAFAVGAEARAWGLHSGDTIGRGDNLLYTEAGWPGISAGFAHGFSEKLEVGGRFDTTYGIEGTEKTAFGFGFAATIRFTFVRTEKLSVEAHVLPGLRFDAVSPAYFGFQFPVGAEAGFHVTSAFIVGAGFDLGLFGDVTNQGYFAVAPVGGPDLEYHLNEHATLGVTTRFGAAAFASGRFLGGNDFAFRMQGFFGYRM